MFRGRKTPEIGMDLLVNNGNGYVPQGGGSGIAERLIANNMNVNVLRPFMDKDGRAYVNNSSPGGKPVLVNNATLRREEWLALDTAVVGAARRRLIGVQDLYSRNLVYRLSNGLGSTVLETTVMSDTTDAEISMDGAVRMKKDRPDFTPGYLPLPLIHKDFQLDIRTLTASRNKGQALDTIQAESAARKVAEMAEFLLFNGYNSFAFGGGTLYGYTDHPQRNIYTLEASWTDSSATGETMLRDVIAMTQASIDDRHYGPWVLYVPTGYSAPLSEDFKANSDKSVRSRLMEVNGILDIRVADFLEDDNIVLVEMSTDNVRMVEGLSIQTVQWATEGGMILNFKVMAIMVPQIRADYDGRSGIAHGSI